MYNQATTVREAALSCLNQQCEPIEILFSDDCSTDESFAILQVLAANYRGPHSLRVQSNPVNLGIGRHYNEAIPRAQGELLITAAGDDVCTVDRVADLLKAWDQSEGKVDLISSYLTDIDPQGNHLGQLQVDDLSQLHSIDDWVNARPYVIGAAHAFTKRLHQHFGPFISELNYEDQIMALRASALGGGVTIKKSLVFYRRGGLSAVKNGRKDLLRKHKNHYGFYKQMQLDLLRINRADLWRFKFRWRLARSAIYLWILER